MKRGGDQCGPRPDRGSFQIIGGHVFYDLPGIHIPHRRPMWATRAFLAAGVLTIRWDKGERTYNACTEVSG